MYEYLKGLFHRKGFWSYNPNNEKIFFFFLLFLRAKEKNSTLPEMFFQTQKLTKTYMFNKVSSYSKTKLSDTDSTRTKDCLISANFSREKIVSAVILFKLVFEETLVLEGGGEGGGGRKKKKTRKILQVFLEGKSPWLFMSNTAGI